jgi:hypothetical protein
MTNEDDTKATKVGNTAADTMISFSKLTGELSSIPFRVTGRLVDGASKGIKFGNDLGTTFGSTPMKVILGINAGFMGGITGVKEGFKDSKEKISQTMSDIGTNFSNLGKSISDKNKEEEK